MIEAIKKDRVAQVLLLATLILLCAMIGGAVFVGWQFLSRRQTVAPTVGPSPTPLVLKFEGTGDKVVFFDAPASGAGLIGFGHNGERNFIVNLMKADGTLIGQPVNQIGEYKGEKTLTVEKGSYMLEITADGDWFVVILPPQ